MFSHANRTWAHLRVERSTPPPSPSPSVIKYGRNLQKRALTKNKMVRSAIFISPSPQMSGPPYLSDSGRNLHENSSSQNALEPPKCTDHKTAQFCFHFLSIFLPANIKLHLKGRATIRISFNGDDFSLFFWGAAATRALGEFSMSRWGHISMSGRGLCMLAK